VRFLSDKIDLSAFFELVRRADHRVLLLDYDGTLAPFTIDRDQAVPYPAVRDLLEEILPLPNTRTVIISGREISVLETLIGLSPAPEMWGSHGWEHQPRSGRLSRAPLDAQSRKKLQEAEQILLQRRLPTNAIERKPTSVAVHWRGMTSEQRESMRARVLDQWSDMIANSSLEIHPFDGGLELRVKGRDKGSAVTEILSGLNGVVAAAYLGDDMTDEDAFRAMTGKGLRVLVGDSPRETLADVWLKPPDELLMFLTRWKEACLGSPGPQRTTKA